MPPGDRGPAAGRPRGVLPGVLPEAVAVGTAVTVTAVGGLSKLELTVLLDVLLTIAGILDLNPYDFTLGRDLGRDGAELYAGLEAPLVDCGPICTACTAECTALCTGYMGAASTPDDEAV